MINKIKSENNNFPKVLFYVGNPYVFRSTFIGYLYEISQKFPVILLSEKLDLETQAILQDKKLFPKVEKIIPVNYFSTGEMNLFSKSKYFYKLIKSVFSKYKPKIIISPNDYNYFELYLMRLGKMTDCLNIAVQTSNVERAIEVERFVDLINANLRFPSFLPLSLRLFLAKIRKYFGHFIYYWILPITVGEKPFFGKSSSILRTGQSGMRDSDYQVVFSKKDYNVFLEEGVPREKLIILSHPLAREAKKFFDKAYFDKYKKQQKSLCVMVPEDTALGFVKSNQSIIINKRDRWRNHVDIIKTIIKIFPDWKIYAKIHPDTKNFEELRGNLNKISKNIEIIDPREPIDKYIEISDAVIGLPLSASTAIFTASLQCPEKPIISLDFHKEILGDYYKNFSGIEYIDNKDLLINVLGLIKDGRYKKNNKNKKQKGDFPNFLNLLEYLLKNRETINKFEKSI
jgi:hypothetical protein